MRPLSAMSKAAFRIISSRQQRLVFRLGSIEFISSGDLYGHKHRNNMATIDAKGVVKARNSAKEGALRRDISIGTIGAQQVRCFLGVGDGDEDSGLTKTYEEKRVVGYSPEQLFTIVAGVDLYEDFVPWCKRSTIVCHKSSEAFDAELQIGFKFLVERYISHVELKKPSYVKTTASESNLFKYLINIWEFKNGPIPGSCILHFFVDFQFQSPFHRQTTASESNLFKYLINIWEFKNGPIPGSCNLHFFVDFQFQSPFHRQVADMFFKEVVSRLVGSFEQRCCRVYGPAVKLLGDACESQRA